METVAEVLEFIVAVPMVLGEAVAQLFVTIAVIFALFWLGEQVAAAVRWLRRRVVG